MSIVLWTLSTAVADRVERGVHVDLVPDDLIDTTAVAPPPPPPPVAFVNRSLSAMPNPASAGCLLRFALAVPRAGSLAVFDASGREVRELDSGAFARGDHVAAWDGRDADGRAAPNGVYFARLRLGREMQTRRIVFRR